MIRRDPLITYPVRVLSDKKNESADPETNDCPVTRSSLKNVKHKKVLAFLG